MSPNSVSLHTESQSCPSQSQTDFHLSSALVTSHFHIPLSLFTSPSILCFTTTAALSSIEYNFQYVCALFAFYLLRDRRPAIYINWRFAWLQIEKFTFFMTLVANKPQFLCTIRPRNFFAQSGAEIYTDCILLLACNFLSHNSYRPANEPLLQINEKN